MNDTTEVEVDLFVPGDWFDVLADDTAEAARKRFADLVDQSYPQADSNQREVFVQVLIDWREFMLEAGALVHGLVSAPTSDGGHASWQVLVGGTEVPDSGEVDLATLITRVLGQELDQQATVVETFETDLGSGVGVIAQPEIAPPTGLPAEIAALGVAATEPVRVGLAACLSFPPRGGLGVLAVGMAFDPNQVLELAAITAVIAGRATFRDGGKQGDRQES